MAENNKNVEFGISHLKHDLTRHLTRWTCLKMWMIRISAFTGFAPKI